VCTAICKILVVFWKISHFYQRRLLSFGKSAFFTKDVKDISDATIRFIKNIMLSVSCSVEKTTFYLLRLSYITMAYRRTIILCDFSESSLDFRCPFIYT
ncbi:hypothetical protein, partial [Phascolarctobacterium succinatutens]|uniref:hypothetical protein n=1 Tax=Phascolarctobacterium succinatutens TaxID=626940 RepID=UPI003AB46CA2